jgi:hypothetical protein
MHVCHFYLKLGSSRVQIRMKIENKRNYIVRKKLCNNMLKPLKDEAQTALIKDPVRTAL